MEKLLSFRFIEKAFTVLALFLYSGALLRLVLSGGANEAQVVQYDSGLILLTFMSLYVVTGVLILLRWKKVLYTLKGDYVILPLLAIAVLSVFWSEAPDLTLKRPVALIGTSLFGIYLSSRYTIRQQLELFAWSYGLSIIMSLIFIIALPSYGISSGLHDGAWRGVYSHKNGLGMDMAVSSIIYFLLALGRDARRRFYLGGLFISVFMLFMARSGTALVTLILTAIALFVYRLIQIRSSFKLVSSILLLLTFGFVVVVWIGNNAEFALAAIGEDITLTSRTAIWPAVIDAIQQKPFLGYGYEAFWRGLNGSSAMLSYANLTATHAHNGLLQLWLSLGFLGVGFFVVGLWSNFLKAAAYIRLKASSESYWPISYLTVLVLINLPESNVLDYNTIDWVLYCAISLSLSNLSWNKVSSIESSVENTA